MSEKEKVMYRKLVRVLVDTFSRDELETLYVESAETTAAVAQAIMLKKIFDNH